MTNLRPKNEHRREQQRRGTAMVEMALVLPLFLMVVLGIVEFGRAMMVGQLVTNAAREGARLGILDGSTNADVTQAIEDLLVATVNLDPGDITISITIDPAPGNSDPGNQVANAQSRDLVNIDIQIPFDKVAYVAPDYLTGKNLVGRAAMRHE